MKKIPIIKIKILYINMKKKGGTMQKPLLPNPHF